MAPGSTAAVGDAVDAVERDVEAEALDLSLHRREVAHHDDVRGEIAVGGERLRADLGADAGGVAHGEGERRGHAPPPAVRCW